MTIRNRTNPFVREHVVFQDLNQTINYLERQNILTAENAVRTLQSNDIFTNGPNLVVDDITDSTGTNNTINISSSTAYFEVDNYQLNYTAETGTGTVSNPDSFNNPNNAFDSNDTTYADKTTSSSPADTYIFGETFSSKYIAYQRVKMYFSGTSGTHNWTIETYNGSIWSSVDSGSFSGVSNEDYDEILYINDIIEGIRITFENQSTSTLDMRVYTIEYGDFDNSDTVIIDSNTTTLDGNETAFAISTPDATIPTNTSISVVVSDGTNSLSAGTIDSISKGVVVGNDDTLTSGTLNLTFTLATTDNTVTPTLPSYGVSILR